MSQLTTPSSCGSSTHLTKRKNSTDSCRSHEFTPQAQRTSKRRRLNLSLKKKFLESPSPTEKIIKIEDDNSPSHGSLSASSSGVKRNIYASDFQELAAKYNIKVEAVKKYYGILKSSPKVPVIRTLPIKKEEDNIDYSFTQLSQPSVSACKKRGRKPKNIDKLPSIKSRTESKSVKKKITLKLHSYLEPFDIKQPIKIKEEVTSPTESFGENFSFDDKNGLNIFQSKSQPLPSLVPNPVKRWKVLIDHSSDEFDDSLCSTSVKTKVKHETEKKNLYVANPFSKVKNKSSRGRPTKSVGPGRPPKQASQNKKKSFWVKNFGLDDHQNKKKKFIETFEKKIKKERKSSESSDNDVVCIEKPRINKIKNNVHKTKEKPNKKEGTRIKGKERLLYDYFSSTSTESCVQLSNDGSLSVNFEPLFTRTSIKVENLVDSISDTNCTEKSVPISFGESISNLDLNCNDANEINATDKFSLIKTGTKDDTDIFNPTNITNSDEDKNTLNDSFVSIDFCDSPTKFNFKTPEKIASAPTVSLINGNGVNKSKGTPKIKSIDTFPSNTIIVPAQKIFSVNDSLDNSNSTDNCSGQECESSSSVINTDAYINNTDVNLINGKQSPIFMSKFNGTMQKYNSKIASPTTATVQPESMPVNKLLPKANPSSEQSSRDYKAPGSGAFDSCKLDETFDSLCQDVTKLSSNENITLYKGDEIHENSAESEKIVLCVSSDDNGSPGFKVPIIFNNNANETNLPNQNGDRNCRQKMGLRSNSNSNPPVEMLSKGVDTSLKQKIQQHNPSQSDSPRSSKQFRKETTTNMFNTTAPTIEAQRFNRWISSSQPSTPTESHSRRNKSFSPIKFDRVDQNNFKLNKPINRVEDSNLKSNKSVNRVDGNNLKLNKSVNRVDENILISKKPVIRVEEINQKSNESVNSPKPLSSTERDPRLNKMLNSPRTPCTESKPSMYTSKSQPTPSTPSTPAGESLSQNSLNDSSSTIADPRLRKRKMREEAEAAEKAAKEAVVENDLNSTPSFAIPRDKPISPPINRKRHSVFQRLGLRRAMKTPSPEKQSESITNAIQDILQGRNESNKKVFNHESEDELCLHADDIFSSDEETNTSPRHRKFTSERTGSSSVETKHPPISIKNRLSYKPPDVNTKQPITLITTKKTPKPMMTRAMTTAMTNRIPLLSNTNQQQTQQANKWTVKTRTTTPSPATTLSRGITKNEVDFNDQFFKMNAMQMLKDVDNFNSQEFASSPYVSFGEDGSEQPNRFDFISMFDEPIEPVQVSTNDSRITFFKNYCFRILRRGKCISDLNCTYSHKTALLEKLIKQKKPDVLYSILDLAIQNKFECFLQNVWKSLLPIMQTDAFNVYAKLYTGKMRSPRFVQELLDFCLENKLHTVESFIKRISPVIEKNDKDIVRLICTTIKPKLTDGFCWETIRDLCQKSTPPSDMIELTLLQCLSRKKNQTHISEVYDLVKNKIGPLEKNKISQSLLKQFYNLVQCKELANNKETLNTVPLANTSNNKNVLGNRIQMRSDSIESIQSLDNCETGTPAVRSQSQSTITKKNVDAEASTSIKPFNSSTRQPNNSPLEVQSRTPNKGEITNFTEYKVLEVDSSETGSAFRDRFWKLFLRVHNIDMGLLHVDYEYVWKIMDEFSKENVEDELLKRAYYHILCKNVKSCDRHVSEIIKQAVRSRWSTSRKSVDILFDVGVCALIDLANNDLWVMASQLLSSVKILEPDEPTTAFILISVEIYLANNDPLEALYLLQKYRLIRTNRDEWLVNDSIKDHEKHRNRLVYILLKSLSIIDQEKAAYLFTTLMEDQYISYYPIDLPLYLDKLTLLMLLYKKEYLVSDICRIVMENDLTFHKDTYQELLSGMLSHDEVLTNQILDYAIHLGYYSDIHIRDGFTTVTIDTKSSEEEIYLLLKRLIYKLKISIGPVIERLKPNQLKVILVFEDIPVDKRLYRDELASANVQRYKHIRYLVNTMLDTRFTPPIKTAGRKTDKFCKLVSRTLVNYLKHWI